MKIAQISFCFCVWKLDNVLLCPTSMTFLVYPHLLDAHCENIIQKFNFNLDFSCVIFSSIETSNVFFAR